MNRFDSYLGKKEYNKYKLARVMNNVEVKKNPSISNSIVSFKYKCSCHSYW